MEAGRELDALMAEYVMGLKLDYEFADQLGVPTVPALRDQYDEWGILPEYSDDIAAAWNVAERMIFLLSPSGPRKGPGLARVEVVAQHYQDAKVPELTGTNYFCIITRLRPKKQKWQAYASTAPLAICLAAVEVLQIDV